MSLSNEFSDRVGRGDCELTVYVYQRPHLRDESLEYELYMGVGFLQNIFEPNPKVYEDVVDMFLSFPERWMNIVEERSLFSRLGIYYPNLKKVTIKTQSVYIIQCCRSEYIRIIKNPAYDGELPQESDEGLLYVPNVGNYILCNTLNVL